MSLTESGRDFIAQSIVNAAAPFFDAGNAHIGVGDSAAAFDVAQTDLQGNAIRQGMEPSYPIVTGNTITFRALFAVNEANFDWQEWGVFNSETAGVLLTRKVEPLGIKTSTQSWQMTVDITISIGV
jgi:hypothetical protein